jgi:hypothetical protein
MGTVAPLTKSLIKSCRGGPGTLLHIFTQLHLLSTYPTLGTEDTAHLGTEALGPVEVASVSPLPHSSCNSQVKAWSGTHREGCLEEASAGQDAHTARVGLSPHAALTAGPPFNRAGICWSHFLPRSPQTLRTGWAVFLCLLSPPAGQTAEDGPWPLSRLLAMAPTHPAPLSRYPQPQGGREDRRLWVGGWGVGGPIFGALWGVRSVFPLPPWGSLRTQGEGGT